MPVDPWSLDGGDDSHLVVTPDGRRLRVRTAGPHDAEALLFHHGTPGCARPPDPWLAACAARGVRWVALSRPGYDGSDRLAGRDVAAVASDVRVVLDELGIGTALVAGWSGGGPHALATAALLPDRVRAVAVVAGVGPWDAPDLDATAGMGADNVSEFAAAVAGERALRPLLDAAAGGLRGVGAEDLVAELATLLPPADARALRAGAAEWMASAFHAALADGVDGWLDDDLAFVRSWGFDLAGLTGIPVSVWQGDVDLMVPPAHADWLAAHLPHADVRPLAGEGHVSLMAERADEILATLVASGR